MGLTNIETKPVTHFHRLRGSFIYLFIYKKKKSNNAYALLGIRIVCAMTDVFRL
jgi:hypothetical protein